MYNMEKNDKEKFCREKTSFKWNSTHYQRCSKKGNSRGNESRLYLPPERR